MTAITEASRPRCAAPRAGARARPRHRHARHGQVHRIDGPAVAFTIELTTPACPLKDEIERNARAALAGTSARPTSRSPGARWSAGPQPRQAEQLVPGRQEHHRGRVGQGRRRQVHGQRQPGGRAGAGRRDGRAAGRRHHRPEHPADARRRGPAQGQRRTTRSRRSSATASRRSRSSSSSPRASRSCGADRSSVARSSSSCATSIGASSTTSSSTCRRARRTPS